jgi:parallel beta-helix repeat protein
MFGRIVILTINILLVFSCHSTENKKISINSKNALITSNGPFISKKMTYELIGKHLTYNVGPGRFYSDPDLVPWGALEAGDVVNIYYRAEPYKFKLCLKAQGTSSKRVIINGVSDSFGNRPKFDFNEANTPRGCNPGGENNIFDTYSEYGMEDFGGIVIKRGVSDFKTMKPKFITIQNLEIFGASYGNSFLNTQGNKKQYGDSAGIWIQPSEDIVIENNIIYNNAFGIYTTAKNNSLDDACKRIIIRNNIIFGNGRENNSYDHNVYIQSTNPIVEGNFIGQLRSGADGVSYKSRSSGEVFRYNYVIANSRALDLVFAENQSNGIIKEKDYGTDYVYGNVIVNDCSLEQCSSHPIHYGGDNLGEQDNLLQEFEPPVEYRSRLFFFNNTFVSQANSLRLKNINIFDLSLKDTTVYSWNNIFHVVGSSKYYWLESAGHLDFVGKNLINGLIDSIDPLWASSFYKIDNQFNSQILGKSFFVDSSNGDFNLQKNSNARDRGAGIPEVVSSNYYFNLNKLNFEELFSPLIKSNGMKLRKVTGKSIDIGAFEY